MRCGHAELGITKMRDKITGLCGIKGRKTERAVPCQALIDDKEAQMIMRRSELCALTWTVVWGILFAVLVFMSVRLSEGRLIYTLDDPYIHLAVAENINVADMA